MQNNKITNRYLDDDADPASIIPEDVTGLGSAAFANYTALTCVIIPKRVMWIGRAVFAGCTGLTSVTIPKSVVEIDAYAFRGCTALTSIIYEGTQEEWDKIDKAERWHYGTPTITVHFEDGSCITIE